MQRVKSASAAIPKKPKRFGARQSPPLHLAQLRCGSEPPHVPGCPAPPGEPQRALCDILAGLTAPNGHRYFTLPWAVFTRRSSRGGQCLARALTPVPARGVAVRDPPLTAGVETMVGTGLQQKKGIPCSDEHISGHVLLIFYFSKEHLLLLRSPQPRHVPIPAAPEGLCPVVPHTEHPCAYPHTWKQILASQSANRQRKE